MIRTKTTSPQSPRTLLKVPLILSLFLLVVISFAASAIAQSSGAFTPTGSMTEVRVGHTATLLPTGTVSLDRGASGASAELYDPATGRFSLTGNMTAGRSMHAATLLADGRVLIAGGADGSGYISAAEIYDPASGVFTATGQSIEPRAFGTTSILLPNGKVLIVGGYGPDWDGVKRTELYDPA